jgi:hypothetical protein
VVANFFGIRDDTFRDGARAAFGDVSGNGVADPIVTGDNLLGTGNQVVIFSGAAWPQGRPPPPPTSQSRSV